MYDQKIQTHVIKEKSYFSSHFLDGAALELDSALLFSACGGVYKKIFNKGKHHNFLHIT